MMSSPRRPRRRDSMDPPPNISDVIHLNEELSGLHNNLRPEYNKHFKKINEHFDNFKNHWSIKYADKSGQIAAAAGVMLAILPSISFNNDFSLIISVMLKVAFLVTILCVVFGKLKKTSLKLTVKEEIETFRAIINPTIETMEQIYQRIEEMLKHPLLLEQTGHSFSDNVTHSFETPVFQRDFSNVGDPTLAKLMDLPGHLSETITKINSVPYALREMMEENRRRRDKPAKTAQRRMQEKVFKKNTGKLIHDMQEGISQIKKLLKSLSQVPDQMADIFERF